jgi:RNA polymerase sigma-70 factor (ECF subfamily)
MENAPRETLFADAVRQHMGIFMKMAYAFAEPADRDDLVQEMLLAAWQALPSFHGGCKLSTFLYRVANNRAMNWRRSGLRYGRRIAALEQCPHLTLAGPTTTPEDAARLEWLYATIRRLPELDRTILMLHLDRLAHQEIAEVTGLTENNVGVRLHRIKRWLAEQKDEKHDEL